MITKKGGKKERITQEPSAGPRPAIGKLATEHTRDHATNGQEA